MAGSGPAPKQGGRRTRHAPQRGAWRPTPGHGWQHGPIPAPPPGLRPESLEAWSTWFKAWWAVHWTADYLPQIRVAILLYDQVQDSIAVPFAEMLGPKGRTVLVPKPAPISELRQAMDGIGATFKGQQDRRWARPEASPEKPSLTRTPYAHLGVVVNG